MGIHVWKYHISLVLQNGSLRPPLFVSTFRKFEFFLRVIGSLPLLNPYPAIIV